MFAIRYSAVLVLIVAILVGVFVWFTTGGGGRFDFKLGLDLKGGTELTYQADTSKLASADIQPSLQSLQAVIERRVNAFGVGEPVVQVEQGGALGTGAYRLIVELPGVTDINAAIQQIGETPVLEFKLVKTGQEANVATASSTDTSVFTDTGLTGADITHATLEFGNGSATAVATPDILVNFNSQGTALFSSITTNNVGSELAIFLDGQLLSAPVIQEKITDGSAVISGSFTADSAKQLASNLNLGALPVPITLVSSETIGASLGDQALHAGVVAGLVGFIVLSIFMLLWYRLPGLVAVVSLTIYIALMLALFKLIPVVLTAAGIAGFILSVGLAVDANILIAERIKEELAAGKQGSQAIREGFARAWLAIRDSNIAHIIAAVILFWLGTDVIQGFALVFGLGVIVSLLSAITISRTFLLALGVNSESRVGRFLMRSGFNK